VDGRSDEWKNGGEANLILTAPTGETVATGRSDIPPGRRTFRTELRAATLVPGEYVLLVRAKAAMPMASPINEAVAVPVASAPHATGALYIRRGASSAGRDEPTADLRFRRTEQMRVGGPDRVGERGDRTPARSNRKGDSGVGRGYRAARCRRLAVDHGPAGARATRAW